MWPRQFLGSVGIALLFSVSPGCNYSNPNEGSGVTDADLKKLMEQEPPKSDKPRVMELTAVETIELLTDASAAEAAQKSLQEHSRRVVGNVLERSPDEGDAVYVILDGGTVGGKAYKVKCLLAAEQRVAVKKTKKGEEVRIEGKCNGELKDDTLEFTECVFEDSSSPVSKPDSKP